VDDYGVVSVDAKDADLQQVATKGGADAHREVVIKVPLGDGVAGGMEHVLVSDAVLVGWLCDTHLDKISCQVEFVKEPCRC
jgi:hypothetical protein